MDKTLRAPEFSIVVEAYTLNEGGAKERFTRSLNNALLIVEQQGDGEVLVLDVAGMIRAIFFGPVKDGWGGYGA